MGKTRSRTEWGEGPSSYPRKQIGKIKAVREFGEGSSRSIPRRQRRGIQPLSILTPGTPVQEEENKEITVEVNEEAYEEGEENEECEVKEDGQSAAEDGEKEQTAAGGKCSKNESSSVSLTDLDLLDCPVCCEFLTIPVFQCENGHLACSCCCLELRNICPSCSVPIGYIRNRAMEKILQSVNVMCQNSKYGCNETLNYINLHDHQKTCYHSPCACPLSDCKFVGPHGQLCLHFSTKHKNSAVRFLYDTDLHLALIVNHKFSILQEEKDGDLFILNNEAEPHRNIISISCVAPSWKIGNLYHLVARSGGSYLEFRSYTKSIQNLDDKPPSVGSLLVPSDLFGLYGQLNLEIHISQPVSSADPEM